MGEVREPLKEIKKMNLAPDRFLKGILFKGFTLQGVLCKTPYTRYSYNSHGKLYDVDIRDSDKNKTYHINCGFATEPMAIHKEIEKHFGI
jgi:hypothetical protein